MEGPECCRAALEDSRVTHLYCVMFFYGGGVCALDVYVHTAQHSCSARDIFYILISELGLEKERFQPDGVSTQTEFKNNFSSSFSQPLNAFGLILTRMNI